MLVSGNCHCENISFTLASEPEPTTTIPARACACSFCTKHGAVWTAIPSASLRVRVKEPTHLMRYAFGTKTAQFHICAKCGVVPLVTSTIEGNLYAVVNSNTFENFDRSMLQYASVSFEGESENARLARRKRNWIGNVEYLD